MSLNGVAEIDKALNLLSKASARSFLKIWASAPSREKAALIEYLTPNLLALIEAGHEEASTLALEQLNWQRAGVELPTELAAKPKYEAIEESIRFLVVARDAAVLREAIWGMVDRHIQNGHNETILLSSLAAGNGYARQPEPGACAFCLMLASRGAVYASAEHASRVGAPGVVMRGFAKKGDRFHDNCKCRAVEVSDGDGLPPQAVELRKLWIDTFYEAGQPILEAIDFESTNPTWKKVVKDFQA